MLFHFTQFNDMKSILSKCNVFFLSVVHKPMSAGAQRSTGHGVGVTIGKSQIYDKRFDLLSDVSVSAPPFLVSSTTRHSYNYGGSRSSSFKILDLVQRTAATGREKSYHQASFIWTIANTNNNQ
jgi:hypothetical protein